MKQQKEYENIKGKLVASIKNNMIQRKIILNEQRQIDLPAVKDVAAGIDSSKIKISKTFPRSKVPLSFVNEIITAELHIDKFEKGGAKSFKLTVINKGTAVSYNAKCLIYKYSTTGLQELAKSPIFYLGIDEVKEIQINIPSNINGQYYAVIHDPILDTFPFGNIDDLIKDRTPFPILKNAPNGWKAYKYQNGIKTISNFWIRYWTIIPYGFPQKLTIVNSYTPPQIENKSEIQSEITIPPYLIPSVRRGEISIKINFSFLVKNDNNRNLDSGQFLVESSGNPSINVQLNNLSEGDRIVPGLSIRGQPTNHTIRYQSVNNFTPLHLNSNTQKIKLSIVISNNGGRNNGVININTANPNPPGPNGIYIRYVQSYFIHRQMKGYPNI